MERSVKIKKHKKLKPFDYCNILFFVIVSLVMLYPFWYVILGSVMSVKDFTAMPIKLIPRNVTFKAYEKILTENREIMGAMWLTVKITVLGTLSSIALTITGAYVFSVKNLPGRKIIFDVVLVTMFFGGGVVPMYILLHNLHMLNTMFVYFVPCMLNTYYMIILRTSFNEVSPSLKEAAEIDGCGHLRIMVQIVVPLSMPAIATILLFYAVDRWNDLYSGIYYTYESSAFSLQVVLYNLIAGTTSVGAIPLKNNNTIASEQVKYACIIISSLPILTVYPFLQKFFTKGIMIGSLKD